MCAEIRFRHIRSSHHRNENNNAKAHQHIAAVTVMGLSFLLDLNCAVRVDGQADSNEGHLTWALEWRALAFGNFGGRRRPMAEGCDVLHCSSVCLAYMQLTACPRACNIAQE